MKIGRNNPCPCGSGKKYKNCCLDKGGASTNPNISNISNISRIERQREPQPAESKTLLMTRTDEIYQPVRIHYQVYDNGKVIKALSKLRCLEFDPDKNRWGWLYEYEAKNIGLNKAYKDVPEQYRPIVIGYLYFRVVDKMETMHIDVRSIQRAIAAIPFFDKYIPRSAAKVRHLDIINRLFGPDDGYADSFDIYFDGDDVKPPVDADQLMAELEALQAGTDDINEKRALAIAYVENQYSQPYTGAEKLPVHFYEEGISALATSLQIRQSVAIKHWFGDTNYTIRDLIAEALRHRPNQ